MKRRPRSRALEANRRSAIEEVPREEGVDHVSPGSRSARVYGEQRSSGSRRRQWRSSLRECELTITSTKDISNISLNGVTTEGFLDGTTTLVIGVAAGDVIAVKSGITGATFTVTECLNDNGDGFD